MADDGPAKVSPEFSPEYRCATSSRYPVLASITADAAQTAILVASGTGLSASGLMQHRAHRPQTQQGEKDGARKMAGDMQQGQLVASGL